VGSLVAAVASSHAFAVTPPEKWDELRERNRNVYAQRQQVAVPPPHPRMSAESLEDVQTRYARVRNGLIELKRIIDDSKPDALIVIGDDQNENFTSQNVPQFAIYTGAEAAFFDRLFKEEKTYRCDAAIARVILDGAVEGGFDLSFSESFPDKRLISHAHVEPLMRILLPNADVPIVPIYVNAIHPPGPTPSRCYAFGQMLGDIIRNHLAGKRIAIYASGGLSHFTAGYPWRHYRGPFGYGCISEDFDRKVLRWIADGQGSKLAELSSAELLDHGEIELRSWIVLAGAVGAVPARVLAYEPLYRGLMGMAVAEWPLNVATVRNRKFEARNLS
jgi:aromatic ring-opening dioxygenase catalytic subunit (LigB family)